MRAPRGGQLQLAGLQPTACCLSHQELLCPLPLPPAATATQRCMQGAHWTAVCLVLHHQSNCCLGLRRTAAASLVPATRLSAVAPPACCRHHRHRRRRCRRLLFGLAWVGPRVVAVCRVGLGSLLRKLGRPLLLLASLHACGSGRGRAGQAGVGARAGSRHPVGGYVVGTTPRPFRHPRLHCARASRRLGSHLRAAPQPQPCGRVRPRPAQQRPPRQRRRPRWRRPPWRHHRQRLPLPPPPSGAACSMASRWQGSFGGLPQPLPRKGEQWAGLPGAHSPLLELGLFLLIPCWCRWRGHW